MGSQDLLLGLLMCPFFFLPMCNIILLLSNIILHYRPEGGRFTNLSTPFSHVYLSGTYPRCVRQLVGHRGHRPRTLPLPLRLLGGVPRILQLSCLVDRTARPVSRLVDAPRRARRSLTAQPRTRAPLRRGVAAPYPVGNLHDSLLRALRARQRDGVVPLRRPCGRAGRCRGRGGGAVGRRCRLPCAGVRLHRRTRLFSTVLFSPRHSPNKFGSALGLSKRFVFNSRFLATA